MEGVSFLDRKKLHSLKKVDDNYTTKIDNGNLQEK